MKIDRGRTEDYWSTRHEMMARAFSSYIEDKLAEKGNRSDFLSFGSDNNLYKANGIKPFPEGDERNRINKAFDELFETIETKETDKGVQLFSKESIIYGDNSAKGMTVNAINKEINKFLGIFKGAKDGLIVKIYDSQKDFMDDSSLQKDKKYGKISGSYNRFKRYGAAPYVAA
jgi:hypothetical protein